MTYLSIKRTFSIKEEYLNGLFQQITKLSESSQTRIPHPTWFSSSLAFHEILKKHELIRLHPAVQVQASRKAVVQTLLCGSWNYWCKILTGRV